MRPDLKPLTQGRELKFMSDICTGTPNWKPLTQGRELKYVVVIAICKMVVKKPLTQGRELKYMSIILIS